jgi:Cytochrome c oxidase subunit IV
VYLSTDPRTRHELADQDLGILPAPSIWPFALALGLTLAATGLVFGFWPLLLGGGLAGLGAVGWQAAVNRGPRRQSLARVLPARIIWVAVYRLTPSRSATSSGRIPLAL